MTEADDEPLTPRRVIGDILATEEDVRTLQQALPDARAFKVSGRTDLMPGRHLAIALTALEEARLRVQEAARLATAQAKRREVDEASERR